MKGVIIPVPSLKLLVDYVENWPLNDRWAVAEEETLSGRKDKIRIAVKEIFDDYIQFCEDPTLGLPECFQEYDPEDISKVLEEIVYQMEEMIGTRIGRKFCLWNTSLIAPIVCMDKVLIIF